MIRTEAIIRPDRSLELSEEVRSRMRPGQKVTLVIDEVSELDGKGGEDLDTESLPQTQSLLEKYAGALGLVAEEITREDAHR